MTKESLSLGETNATATNGVILAERPEPCEHPIDPRSPRRRRIRFPRHTQPHEPSVEPPHKSPGTNPGRRERQHPPHEVLVAFSRSR